MTTVEEPSPTTGGRSYAGKDPDERRAERRERLIAATVEVVGTEGYQAATVERLCREAGVSPKHLYEQLDGRQAVVLAAYDAVMAEVREDVDRALAAAGDDVGQRIRAGVEALVGSYLDDPRRARLACLEAVGVDPALDRRRREVLRDWAALLAREATGTGLTDQPELAETICLALVGGANELFVDWLLTSPAERPSTDHLVEALSRLISAAATMEP